MEFLGRLQSNPFCWLVLSLVALFSLGWSIYSHYSTNRKRKISFRASTFHIIKQAQTTTENLQVLYSGKPISNFTVTQLALWNSSNKVINSLDMVPGHDIQISMPGNTEILASHIIYETEKANKANIIKVNSNTIQIKFDYFDIKDGIVVQICHSGGTEETFSIEYKIKGGQSCHSPLYKNETGIRGRVESLKSIACIGLTLGSSLYLFLATIAILTKIGLISNDRVVMMSLNYTDPQIIISECIFAILFLLIAIILKLPDDNINVPTPLRTYAMYKERPYQSTD